MCTCHYASSIDFSHGPFFFFLFFFAARCATTIKCDSSDVLPPRQHLQHAPLVGRPPRAFGIPQRSSLLQQLGQLDLEPRFQSGMRICRRLLLQPPFWRRHFLVLLPVLLGLQVQGAEARSPINGSERPSQLAKGKHGELSFATVPRRSEFV